MKRGLIRFFRALIQVLKGKQLIKDEAKFKVVCLGAAFIHLIFCFLMHSVHADILYYYNICIVFLYIFMGTYLNSKEKYGLLMAMIYLEIEAHSALASFLLGFDCGFMLYTVALIPAAFYLSGIFSKKNRHTSINIAVILSMFVVMCYLVVSILTPKDAFYDLSRYGSFRVTMRYINIFIAFFLQISFSLVFALEAEYMSQFLAKENVKLSEEAGHDPLTGLWNRRSLTNAVNEAIGQMERIEVFSVVMMDIDDFKKVNDTYGHDTGDTVLVRLAEIIRDEVRAGDYSCRWGGEEFLLFAHGPRTEVQFVAERILDRLRNTEFRDSKDNIFKVTLTAGVAEYRYGAQLRNVIEAADKRLYYGKTHGKDRVVTST